MWETIKSMPPGVLMFMGYALLVLSVLGVFMRFIIDLAVESPISFPGLVWMALLAYLVFTMTLVLQRKQAGYGLALGLTSLAIPAALYLAFDPSGIGWMLATLILLVFAIVVLALRRPRSRAWFSEP